MGDAEKVYDETEATNGEEARRAAEIAMDNLECGGGNVVPLQPNDWQHSKKARDKAEGKKKPESPETEEPDAPETEAAKRKLVVDMLNASHAVINNVGGKCLVLSWMPSPIDEGIKIPVFQSFGTFRERYSNRYVSIEGRNKPVGTYWLKHRDRRTFEGIDLVPDGPEVLSGNRLNLWGGWGVEPKVGDWSLMRRHVETILANGDPDFADYILRWSAWAVQNPGTPAEVALVLKGEKGSGKGTWFVALRRIFGPHGLHIASSKHLIGSFNGHTRYCLFLFADEAFWAGDVQGESELKAMLTEPTRMVEQKFVDAGPIKNRLHVGMAANAAWAVPASHDERRFAVGDVSSARIGEIAYFNALYAEMEHGGLAAMFHDLRSMPLGNWHPRMILKNEALRKQKEQSLPPWEQWWLALLQDGYLPGGGFKSCPNRASSSTLFRDAQTRVPKLRRETETKMGFFLRECGCTKERSAEARGWQFPELDAARAAWEKRYGPWPWHELGLKTWGAPPPPSVDEVLNRRG
jgi:Family of unknown function (DUF5906)